MRHLLSLRSRAALFVLLAGVVFALLALVIPKQVLLPVMNAACIGIVGTVTVIFSPLIVRAFKDKEFDRVSQLMIGMLLMWLSLLGSRFTSLYINITGDVSVAQSPVVAFLAYMAVLGGALHITAPSFVPNSKESIRRNFILGATVGVALTVLTLIAQWKYNLNH